MIVPRIGAFVRLELSFLPASKVCQSPEMCIFAMKVLATVPLRSLRLRIYIPPEREHTHVWALYWLNTLISHYMYNNVSI